MLKRIQMAAGSNPAQPSLDVELSSLTVFVGPNNSGKSRALQEIENWMRSAQPTKGMVVKSVEFEPWVQADIEKQVGDLEVEPNLSEALQPDHVIISKLNPQTNASQRVQLHKPILLREAQNPNTQRTRYSTFLSLFTLKLDGTNRLALTNPQKAGDLQKTAPNHLAHLFVDNSARDRLRHIVHEAFGKYLVVDPTNIGELRLRLSSRAPVDEREEKGWDSVAQAFHGDAIPITEASDGVKAFVGILSTIIAGDPKITLIDEPEAFLHPALSARLGKEVTAALGVTNKRIFVSTHSASFLMGCFQAGAAVNIVRLTYDYQTATARLLKREKLAPLMRNPLLRSVGVLNALFYNAVVVTESDADRAFYQEINERLLAVNDPRGINGCLFLNAQNKQTVWDIVRPLRELGIPAAGVVDIDVLKDGGVVWKKPLDGAFVPVLSHPSFQAERAALLGAFEASGKDMKRDGGIALLSKEDQEACRNLFDKLAEYGVFIVPRGELESWLPTLGATQSKSSWLLSIFEKMGDDPSASDYIRPEPGDVWDFLGRIRRWVIDGNRKGIPE
jgi:ABC-type cobalamin/Fe3+-siderophores transport system ATPase subunit